MTLSGLEQFSFIGKLLPADDTGRAYVFTANLLEKEIEVYFEVLPSLKQFLRRQPSGDQSHLVDDSTSECVYGSHNNDGAGVLVFRSSLDAGFQHCDEPDGLSPGELRIAATTIARIHASGRALIAKNRLEAMKSRYPYLCQVGAKMFY